MNGIIYLVGLIVVIIIGHCASMPKLLANRPENASRRQRVAPGQRGGNSARSSVCAWPQSGLSGHRTSVPFGCCCRSVVIPRGVLVQAMLAGKVDHLRVTSELLGRAVAAATRLSRLDQTVGQNTTACQGCSRPLPG